MDDPWPNSLPNNHPLVLHMKTVLQEAIDKHVNLVMMTEKYVTDLQQAKRKQALNKQFIDECEKAIAKLRGGDGKPRYCNCFGYGKDCDVHLVKKEVKIE